MIDLQIFKFPVSLIVAAVVVTAVVCLRKIPLVRRIAGSALASRILIVAVAAFIAVEGIWGLPLHRHWTFVAVVLALMLSLGITVTSDCKGKSLRALGSHLGLWLVLFGGLLGAADRTDAQVRLYADGESVEAPFVLSLEEFNIDYYNDGISPRQFTSRLTIDGNRLTTSVNHPCRYKGYHIYQSGYDLEGGPCTVLRLVRDPWLPIVALGALMMLTAAILGLGKVWNSRKALVAALALAVIFAVISVARINFGTLVPALRSFWFIPHLAVYMLAYALMALALVTRAETSEKFLSTASSLLLAGMIFGAVWAQQVWCNYWTWDSKECWAAVTWLLTLAGTHTTNKKARLAFTILAFLAMQITWYGVNYLPAAGMSLHTY